jgi:predicted hotdog family 3-hydroxylacyl-ACP dehydratase
MALLDEVVTCDEQDVSCSARVTATCPFVRDSELPNVALLEYMAQAVGAFVTLERRRTAGGPPSPRIGYLVSAREVNFRVAALPVGKRFQVSAHLDWHERPMARFSCRVHADGQCLAEGQLTVYARAEETP